MLNSLYYLYDYRQVLNPTSRKWDESIRLFDVLLNSVRVRVCWRVVTWRAYDPLGHKQRRLCRHTESFMLDFMEEQLLHYWVAVP